MKFDETRESFLMRLYAFAYDTTEMKGAEQKDAAHALLQKTEVLSQLAFGWTYLSGSFIALADLCVRLDPALLSQAVSLAKDMLPLVAKRNVLARQKGLGLLYRMAAEEKVSGHRLCGAPFLLDAYSHALTPTEKRKALAACRDLAKEADVLKLYNFENDIDRAEARALFLPRPPVRVEDSKKKRTAILGSLRKFYGMPVSRRDIPDGKTARRFMRSVAALGPK